MALYRSLFAEEGGAPTALAMVPRAAQMAMQRKAFSGVTVTSELNGDAPKRSRNVGWAR